MRCTRFLASVQAFAYSTDRIAHTLKSRIRRRRAEVDIFAHGYSFSSFELGSSKLGVKLSEVF